MIELSKSAFPELIESLGLAGFTKLQAAAYIALLKMGEETGSAVAKESEINRSKIYDILEQLEELSAVEKVSREGKIRYRAVSPDIVLPKILQDFSKEINNSIRSLKSIANIREEIGEDNITLTKLFLKDLDLKEYQYLISSSERARVEFVDLLDKNNQPDQSVKILNINDTKLSRGTIMLVNDHEILLFGTPIGKSVDALRIGSPNLALFYKGIIENGWLNDLPSSILRQIENGVENAVYIGKSLNMKYSIGGREISTHKRPISFIVTDEVISFYYEGLSDPDPRIPIQFINRVTLEPDNAILIQSKLQNGSIAELWIKMVESPLYLKNLLITLSK